MRGDWWELYFIPVQSRTGGPSSVLPAATSSAYGMPLLLFLCVNFLCSFLLMSNQNFMDRSFENAKSRITNNEQAAFLEHTEEANRQILQHPGMRIAISTTLTFKGLISFLSTAVLFWFAFALYSGRWNTIPEFWLVMTSSWSILVLGSIVFFILQFSLLTFDDKPGFAWLFRELKRSSFTYELINQFDLFTVWFIYLLSSRLGRLYGEHRFVLFILFTLIIILIHLLFHLLGVDFMLG